MYPTINDDSILKATSWCVVREQVDQYLVYNSHTDELHLLPPTGFYVYRRCDGLSTLAEIEADLLPKIPGEPDVVRDGIRQFFGMLLERGIVEADS